MKKIISTFLVLTLLQIPVLHAASDPKTLSLNEAILLALRYNPDVKNAEIQRVSDKFSLRTTQNEYELQYALTGRINQDFSRHAGISSSHRASDVTGSASLRGEYGTQYNLSASNPINNPGNYNPGLDLNITQPLLRGFGRDVTLTPLYDAEDSERIAQLSLKNTLISTVNEVIRGYRSLIEVQNNVQTSKLALNNLSKTIANDKALIKAGRKAPSEILQGQSQFASEEVTYQNSKNAVVTARYNLLNTIGLAPETPIKVPANLKLESMEIPDAEKSYEIALRNNISYQQSLLNLEISKRSLMIAENNSKVQLNLTLDASTGHGTGAGADSGFQSLTNNKDTDVAVGLTFDIPINNYSLKQQVVNARISLQQAKTSLAAQKRIMRTTILNDISDIKSRVEQIKLARNALKLQKQNQDNANAKLKLGLVSTFEVTQTQQDLNSARQSLITNQIDYLNSLTSLQADMGTLLEEWDLQVRY